MLRVHRIVSLRAYADSRGPAAFVLALLLAATAAGSAAAQGRSPEVKDGITLPSIATSLPDNGDPGGVRKWLADRGFTYTFDYTSEVLSNVTGGVRRGTIFEGRLQGTFDANLETIAGLNGLSFHATGAQIHGTGGVSRDLVGNFQTISNIEALPSTRLLELWLEQKIFGDTASLRVGQLVADAEFFISDYSLFFMNSGWPAITKLNLPSGGPAYPLATPGIRLKVEPNKNWTLLAAVFNGDPAGPGPGSPEERNRHGLNFRVTDPPLAMAEVQYKYNQGKTDSGLAGIIRVGTWHHFGRFDDQRLGIDGLSLANAASSGMPRRLRGNDGIYGIIDQQIYRLPGGDVDSGVTVFGRASASPSDRNPIQLYLDGGIVFSGMLAGRPDDKFGATVLYSSISDRARALDRDAVFFTGMPLRVRDAELAVEVSYYWQVIPGWWLQPDFQYIFHPGGYISDPTAPSPATPIKDAVVVGLRSFIRY